MNPQDLGPRVRKFQDPGIAIEALVRWDELSQADLREIEADPHLAPRLSTLRAAEEWLQRGGAASDGCPSSEELYDYAGGPGHAPLTAEAVSDLGGCRSCSGSSRILPLPQVTLHHLRRLLRHKRRQQVHRGRCFARTNHRRHAPARQRRRQRRR